VNKLSSYILGIFINFYNAKTIGTLTDTQATLYKIFCCFWRIYYYIIWL